MSKTHWYAPFKGVFAPIVKGPDEGPFLCVTFNIDYAPFIRGALFSMLQRQMWSGSDAEVDTMIMKVHQLLYMFGQETACALPDDPSGGYEEMASLCESLRYQDGKLQALCCGEWVDIGGQLPGGTGEQPDGSGGIPEPGGCVSYHANLIATQQWILPAHVSAGDVLTFSNPHGIAEDGSGSHIQYCPAGDIYLLGSCTGIYGNDGGDPAPTEAHMGTICQIAGVWYGTQSPITIPGGVSDAPVIFQVNDSTLADNAGGYNFDVEVCNNQAGTFEHDFNFLLSDGGWVPNIPSSINNIWAAGVGWQDAYDAPDLTRGVQIKLAMPSTVITSMEIRYTMSGKDATAITDGAILLPTVFVMFSQPGQNGNIIVSGGVNHSGTALITSSFSSFGGGNVGSTVVTGAKVRGLGADPF